MTAILFHPGDLSLGEWVVLLVAFIMVVVLPIVLIGFIIFKVINRHSDKSEESITLRLNESKRK